ncbi:MAG: esterase/lipase [Gammaproteobacteria bacterium]|jgi:arylformamidase|nr:esterase/lipase [Gammaproteobacteria bacterium]
MQVGAAENRFLDRQYNPRTQVPEFADFFARWKRDARQVRTRMRARLDLPYGPAPAERLDFFPAAGASNPLLVFLHGGYWRALDKDDFSWVAPPYVSAGISVAVINYGLLPATALMEIVAQVRRACAWLHHNARALDVDVGRIACSGHSAGGHLTAMMIATDWPNVWPELPRRLLSGAVTISGLFDLEPLTRAEFLRNDLHLDQALARDLSPVLLPWRNDVPIVRAVGEHESSEFHRQSRLIAEHWSLACARELIDVPGCNHLSVCDAFADTGSALFQATRDLFS